MEINSVVQSLTPALPPTLGAVDRLTASFGDEITNLIAATLSPVSGTLGTKIDVKA